MSDSEHRRLGELYDAWAHRVLAYASRQVGPVDAEDVLAEVYTVAWRRLDSVPRGDDALPWLLAVARNVVRNDRRSAGRRLRLVDRLRDRDAATAPEAGQVVADRDEVLRALALLSEREREALLLLAWDGLDHEMAARVCGCSPRALRARASRARTRLSRVFEAPEDEPAGREATPPGPATHGREAAPRRAEQRTAPGWTEAGEIR